MRYALLIYTNEAEEPDMSGAAGQEIMAAYGAFTEEVTKVGVMEGGDALESVTAATTVRVRNGQRLTTDGPFAETKEQLGGFYILKCQNLDEALDYAAKIPGAQRGCIEVRPIMEMGDQ